MTPLLNVVLPVFAVIGLGFLCGKLGLLGPLAVRELNRFSVFLAQPALLFGITSRARWSDYRLDFVVTIGVVLIATFLIVLFVVRQRGRRGDAAVIEAFCACSANCGLLGIPLSLLVFGEAVAPFSGAAAIWTGCILQGVGLFAMELVQAHEVAAASGGEEGSAGRVRAARRALVATARQPMLIAPALGFVVSTVGITPPVGVTTLLDLLAGAAIPLALASLGLFLHANMGQVPVRTILGGRRWAPLTAVKLVGQPALAWLIAGPILHAPQEVVRLAVLMAMMPTGAGPFILAQLYERDGRTAAQVTLMTTVLSVVTISVMLSLWT